jgi:hypothetical protein
MQRSFSSVQDFPCMINRGDCSKLRWSSIHSTQNETTAMATVCERQVLEESDHDVDVGQARRVYSGRSLPCLGRTRSMLRWHLSICTGITIEARRASDVDDDQVRRNVLRLLLHLCYYNFCMSPRILIGGLLAVLPGELAVRGVPGGQCAVCESCKALICKVLR